VCDINRGRLLLLFSRDDVAARRVLKQIQEHEIEHVSYVQGLDQRLEALKLKAPVELPLELHLLEVPPDQETWKIGFLNFYYKLALMEALSAGAMTPVDPALTRSDRQFTLVADGLLSLSQKTPQPPLGSIHATKFVFDPVHAVYKSSLNLPPQTSGRPKVKVAVLDTGLASDAPFPASLDSRNLVSAANVMAPADDNGHGTVVALIIHDLAPRAEFAIYKVVDQAGRASEWDTLAALVAAAQADIINLSLAFGLEDANCPICGRETGSARSAVFEVMLADILWRNPNAIVVAAAGNQGRPMLSFPARFGGVVAISSVTSHRVLSSFSNYGDLDEAGKPHDGRFALPGGENAAAAMESVGKFSPGAGHFEGTSFAAAYASGLIANACGAPGYGSGQGLIGALRQAADKGFPTYSPLQHGNGLMRM